MENVENTSLITTWPVNDLKLDVDAILRGQGADPAVLRARRPRLVEIAEVALENSRYLLEPRVYTRQLKVGSLRHEKLELEGGLSLRGAWITRELAPTETVHVIVCTVGPAIDEAVSELMGSDLLQALALDGVGSAGVEALAQAVCNQIEERAAADGKQTTVPFSPGMLDWTVEEGQPAIFGLFAGKSIGVELTTSFLMRPRKSLSMLVGVGSNLGVKGTTCDYCAMQGTCKYRSFGGHSAIETGSIHTVG